jgi:hypothetical protein
MNMRRIAPQEVVDAYIATGCYRTEGVWLTHDGNGACAIGALGLAAGLPREALNFKWTNPQYEIGIHEGYMIGFVGGFESDKSWLWSIYVEERLLAVQGFCDGIRARHAVLMHFGEIKAQPERVTA